MTAEELISYTIETHPEMFLFYQATLPTQCSYSMPTRTPSSEHWQEKERERRAALAAKEG